KTMSAPLIASWTSSLVSSTARLPISGFMPAPRPLVRFLPMWIFFLARALWRSWASVLMAMNSTPLTLELTMWLTVFLPEPPTPMTLILANDSTSGLIWGMVFYLLIATILPNAYGKEKE